MNRHLIYILVALVLVGCSEKYEEELGLYPTLTPRYMTVTPTSLVYASSPEMKAISITSTQTPWKIENGIDWVSASPTSGSTSATVSIGVSENKSGDNARTGIFYLKADVSDWKFEAPISVTQAGATPEITLSKSEIEFSGASNIEDITVTANCTWSVSSSSNWLTASRKNNTISLSVTSNETSSYRTATISVIHSGTKNTSKLITIRQAPASINASTEPIVFNNTAGGVNITIESEANWTATTSSSWIEVSPTSGSAGTSTIAVSVAPNTSTSERTGYIILSIGEIQRIRIPVRQYGIYIEVDNNNLNYSAFGETQTISISSNTEWEIIDCPSWIDVSKTTGKGDEVVAVTAHESKSTNQRYANISITQKGVTIGSTILISQEGKSFSLSAQTLIFEDVQNSQSVQIFAEDYWTVKNDNEWVSVSQLSGSGNSPLSITVTENETENTRQGKVDITMLDKMLSLMVTQNGKVFSASIDKEEFDFSASGGNATMYITSNTYWTLSNAPSWISLSKTKGKGSESVLLTAQENPSIDERSGTMYLNIDGKSDKKTISLRQYGKSINLSTNSLTFSNKEETQSVSIITDGTWSASSDESWISFSPETGTGNSILKVSVSENMSVSERLGSITISMGGKDIVVSVTQGSKSFSLTPSSLSFSDKASSQDVAIETDGTWDAMTNSSWITLTPVSSSGKSTLQVTVSENTTNSERNGIVSVTMGDKTLQVTVNQKGKYLTINNALLSYSSKGGSIGITITTNDVWSASIEEEVGWLTISKANGNGTAEINVVADDNPSVNTRTGSVIIETPHNQSVRVVVTQDARYLTVDTREILFYSKGGTSETITISTDGTYSISCSDSWFTVNQSSNTFTVTVSENTTTEARTGSITISLTDLKEGTYSIKLTVNQLNYGGSFLLKDYGDDTDYDNMGTSTGSLTITVFGSDQNYDTSTTSGTTLSVSNYKSDSSWDTSANSNVTVNITGYKSDNNLDSQTNTSGAISKTGFESDSNWQ